MSWRACLMLLRHDAAELKPLRRQGDMIMGWVNLLLFAVSVAIGLGTETLPLALAVGVPTLALMHVLQQRLPGELITRSAFGAAFMVFTALMIQQLHGLIEAHFAAFGLIGFLLYYRDWRAILSATVVIYLHHLIFTLLQGWIAGFHVFVGGADWSIFFTHVAYFLPYVAIMAYIALRLEREESANQRVLLLASRIALGEVDRLALPKEGVEPLLLAVAEIWDQFWRLTRELPSPCLVVRRRDCAVIVVNRAFADLVGRTGGGASDEAGEDLIGRPLSSLGLGIENWPVCRQSCGPRCQGEYRLPTRDKGSRTVEVSAGSYSQGADELLVLIVRDITDERQSEEQLRAAKEAAERALEELSRTQADLIQAEKMASLGQLVAGVAHEINTPIGIALTSASLLADETALLTGRIESGQLRKADLNRYVGMAQEATTLLQNHIARAAGLVQSFKQVAVDQTADERRQFVLGAWLEDLAFSFRPAWKHAGHRLVIHCPDHLELDTYPGALGQVLANLVMNSVHHAYGEGDTGTLTITATAADADTIELTYADDGRGIPPENRTKVFDPFFTTRRGAGNTGLGLHIVFNLLTARLGGRIELDGTVPIGTCFRIRFPRVASAGTGS